MLSVDFIFVLFTDDTHVFAQHDKKEQRTHRSDLVDIFSQRRAEAVSLHSQQVGR